MKNSTSNNTVDILILGAGVAGLHAGYLLQKAKHNSFLILEGNDEPGRKLTVAGGGYGNLTNTNISTENYVGQDSSFTTYALQQFPFKKAIELYENLQIPLEERDFGQVFSLIPAWKIRDRLTYVLPIEYNCQIQAIEYINNIYHVNTSKGLYKAKNIILATGSSAYPQLNASDIGLDLARDLSLEYKNFVPALTPFILPSSSPLARLAGISIDVGIEVNNKKIIRPLLFTHTGLSGPAILLLSCYYKEKENNSFIIDFMPNNDIIDLCHDNANGKLLVKNLISKFMPDRLMFALIPEELDNRKVAELSKKDRLRLQESINKCNISEFKLAPLEKAEAAKNGILTTQLNPKTMQANKYPNLYIVGEVMDIVGHLGGYNIHWALASSYTAIKHLLTK